MWCTRPLDRGVQGPSHLVAAEVAALISPSRAMVAPGSIFMNSIGMKLALIPTGEFVMGSPDDDRDAQESEKPQHRVVISKPFYLGVHEVTRGQFRRFVEATGYQGLTQRRTAMVAWAGLRIEGFFEQNRKYSWRNPEVRPNQRAPGGTRDVE